MSVRTTSVSQFLTLRKRGHLEGLPFFVGDCFPEAGGWRRDWRRNVRQGPAGTRKLSAETGKRAGLPGMCQSYQVSAPREGDMGRVAGNLAPLPMKKEALRESLWGTVLRRGIRNSKVASLVSNAGLSTW